MLNYVPRVSQTPDAQAARRLETSLGVTPIMARLLLQRGLNTPEAARDYLSASLTQLHDPMDLLDMDRAVARIRQAVAQGERITIFGDYDVDGVCATSVLMLYLRSLGAQVDYYIPHRHKEGYGMNPSAIRTLAEGGAQLIISVDCGVTAAAEIALAYDLGMEAIVTDHHECPEKLPECCAVVNCKRPGQAYPFQGLCGAGTVGKVVQALGGVEAVRPYLDLLALATVADIVPLLDENRVLVKLGLEAMATPRVGLAALLQVAGLEGRPSAGQLGFQLGPRINAGGRMDASGKSVELLTTEDPALAARIAQDLDDNNLARKQTEDTMLRQALSKVTREVRLNETRALVLWQDDWNSGVLGIVASRLVERFHRPVVLLAREEDGYHGSARSIPGVHLYQALCRCRNRFLRFGGHEQAAGMSVEPEELEHFAQELNRVLWEDYTAGDFVPQASYDLRATVGDMTLRLAEELEMLEPYGFGCPTPVFRLDGVAFDRMRSLGREHRHFQANVVGEEGQRADIIAFGRQPMEAYEIDEQRYDVLVTLDLNVWRGKTSLRCMLGQSRLQQRADTLLRQIDRGEGLFHSAFWHQCALRFRRRADQDLPIPEYYDHADVKQALFRLMAEQPTGVLALVMDPDAARDLVSDERFPGLLEQATVAFGRTSEGEWGQNTVLLAPRLEEVPVQHVRHLLLFGGGFCTIALDFLVKQLHAGDIRIIMEPTSAVSGLSGQAALSDDNLRRIFALTRRGLRQPGTTFATPVAPLSWVAQTCQTPLWQAEVALTIFEQLGLLDWGPKAPYLCLCEGAGKVDLAASEAYRTARTLAGMLR